MAHSCERQPVFCLDIKKKGGSQSMSLQFIFGNSGSGKSHYLYQQIVEESIRHPEKNYLVLVPEQFTMQTQKDLCMAHPRGGIMNIDVLSFGRLAHRVFEETGKERQPILDDEGKNLVLRKIAGNYEDELTVLKGNLKKQGYISEVKSVISEFTQYGIDFEQLDSFMEGLNPESYLYYKLKDIRKVYEGFEDYLRDKYITKEELLDVLSQTVPEAKMLKDSVIAMDGFTGFTPVQNRLIGELLKVCDKIMLTVEIDRREDPFVYKHPYQLFALSKQMVTSLTEVAQEVRVEIDEPVWLCKNPSYRFKENPEMAFLEEELFRYSRRKYSGEKMRSISLHEVHTPQEEAQYVAEEIRRLVREEGYRYREIAVIASDLSTYADALEKACDRYEIPVFMDHKKSILLNSFVEYLRSLLVMVEQNYTYESVFRYLRCGMSDLSRREVDILENYVIALGIRGFRKWNETWVRIYRGMDPAVIMDLNEIREHFTEEVRELAEGFSGKKKTVGEYSRYLYDFIVKRQIQEKLKVQELHFKQQGDRAREKEYAQIYGIIMDLLDKMVSILGEEVVSTEEFRQLLETGMTQAKVALIPPGIDQVLIGDMERTRLKDIRALFFVGVNEGCIPKNTESGGILTEMDRDFLGNQGIELAPGPKELMNMQRFYLYLNLTKPSESLCLSYSRSNGKGEAVGPAFLIRTIQTLFPEIHIERAEKPEKELDLLETPNTSVGYLLENLTDEEKRKEWIDSMEKEIAAFENISRTGNQVLDTILAAKIFHCRKNHIQITCVADGKLLDHMHVTDICSIFGNALDNAIEHVILIPDPEKRLIHLTVSAQKGFVFIKIENYCEAEISKNEEDLITTTKKDSKNHGFGLKSIRKAVEKYDGSVVFGVQQNWFELKILLPRVL